MYYLFFVQDIMNFIKIFSRKFIIKSTDYIWAVNYKTTNTEKFRLKKKKNIQANKIKYPYLKI